MKAVPLIFVGGFLGAGKTTLLWETARRLSAQGRRVGLITNDQAPDLVDTAFLAGQGLEVREVAGSCFCCNFAALVDAADALAHDVHADVLVAEPVGSCTDLSATILQPLKDRFAHEFVLAPLSVLADPARLGEVLTGRANTMHAGAAYILRKQLEEADLILLNKIDLLPPEAIEECRALVAREFPGTPLRCLSALAGRGVDEWLAEVLGETGAGRRIADVDYDTYAAGEAAMGWLNASIGLATTDERTDWRGFCLALLARLQKAFQERRAEVGHVKLLLAGPNGQLVANLTRTDGQPSLRGQMPGAPCRVTLILNARVEMPPEELEAVVRNSLEDAAGAAVEVTVSHLQSLRPGRPRPTYRYAGPL